MLWYLWSILIANDLAICCSNHRMVFILFEEMIDWKSSKQHYVSISSTESEHSCSIYCSKRSHLMKLSLQTDELHCKLIIHNNNWQIIQLLTAPSSQLVIKLCHIDIHNHWLCEQVTKDLIDIQWMDTKSMIADELIKALERQKYQDFVHLIELIDIYNQIV